MGDSLKLLHPIMPFVTEEIYTKLYNYDESIMISKWPEYKEEFNFEQEEEQIEKIKQINRKTILVINKIDLIKKEENSWKLRFF